MFPPKIPCMAPHEPLFSFWYMSKIPCMVAWTRWCTNRISRRSLRLAPIAIKITGETWNSRLTAILFFFFSENFRNVKNLENTTVHGHLRLTTIRGWSFAKRALIDRLMFYRGYGDVSIELNVILYLLYFLLYFLSGYSHWSCAVFMKQWKCSYIGWPLPV